MLLEVKNLTIKNASGEPLVSDSTFCIRSGQTLCLIGESGSGKTLTGRALIGLLPRGMVASGQLLFGGRDINGIRNKTWRDLRGRRIGWISQHPEQALHPVLTIGTQLVDMLVSHLAISRREAKNRAEEALRQVSLRQPKRVMAGYPHQMSGGMNQRIQLAMALSTAPELLIADEPTSALDVKTQEDILTLLRETKALRQLSLLFITHDLQTTIELADSIAVMQRGVIVEQGPASEVLRAPQHPYTQALWTNRWK